MWFLKIFSTLGGLFKLISSFLSAKQRNEDREAGKNEQKVADLAAQNRAKDKMLDAAVNQPDPDRITDVLRNHKF